MIERIKAILGGFEIVFVCRTGSRLFCKNCADDDWVVVVKDWDCDSKHFRLENVCVYCYSQSEFQKFATGQLCDYRSLYSVCLLFAKGENILYGENPIPDYNWWNYQKAALKNVVEVGARSFFNDRITNSANPAACIKKMVWGLATCYAIRNQSDVFTDEQKWVMQSCHDNVLPLCYKEILKRDLLKLGAEKFIH